MTAHTLRPPSRMVELGQVISTYQKSRRYTDHAVCDFIGASEKLYGQWKAGEKVPDGQRWGRLCRMIHELSTFRPLWQEATNEQAQLEIKNKPLAKLGDKFAGIKLVPTEPKVKVEPPQEQELAMEAHVVVGMPELGLNEGDVIQIPTGNKVPPPGFDVKQLPKGWRQPENVLAREMYAREYIRQHPDATNAQIREAQVAQFGMASAAKRMTEIKEDELAQVAKELKRQERKEARDADPYAHQRAQERKAARQQPAPEPKTPAQLVAEAVAAASELLIDSIPNLSSFTLLRDAAGKTTVSYKTRKVVEDEGTITLGEKS